MDQLGNDTSIEQIELLVLRALCGEVPRSPVNEAAMRILAGYAWREPIHQAMFECLMSMPRVKLEDIRRQLLSCLTRKGFPDVETEMLFDSYSPSSQEVEELMQRLASSIRVKQASKKT